MQFGRALRTLDVGSVHAGSPQAKGRVERANGTLQDRLVKEMRLRGIGGMETGNAFLPELMADFDWRFAVEPRCPADAHRPVLHDAAELGLILSLHSTRKLSQCLMFQYRSREHRIQVKGQGYGLRGVRVTVCEGLDGRVSVLRDGRPLAFRVLAEGGAAGRDGGRKERRPRHGTRQGAPAGEPELEAIPRPSLDVCGAHRHRAYCGGAVTSGRIQQRPLGSRKWTF